MIKRVLLLGAAVCGAALVAFSVAAQQPPAGLKDWAQDTVQVGLGYRIDGGSPKMPAPHRRPTADGWFMSTAMRDALRRAEDVKVVFTDAPRARRTSDAREWIVDIPLSIQIRINGEPHLDQGEVHMTAVEQPDDGQPFTATETWLDP